VSAVVLWSRVSTLSFLSRRVPMMCRAGLNVCDHGSVVDRALSGRRSNTTSSAGSSLSGRRSVYLLIPETDSKVDCGLADI
jgi:hypothetical protein